MCICALQAMSSPWKRELNPHPPRPWLVFLTVSSYLAFTWSLLQKKSVRTPPRIRTRIGCNPCLQIPILIPGAFAHPLALKQISRKINKLDCCSAAPSVTSRYRSALPEFCDKLISVCISAAPWPAPTGAVTSWRALYGDELESFLIFVGCCHPPLPVCFGESSGCVAVT